jgi:hypothetical protein
MSDMCWCAYVLIKEPIEFEDADVRMKNPLNLWI